MKKLTLRTIEREICRYFDCAPKELLTRSRHPFKIKRKQMFHYFANRYSNKTNAEIGAYKSKGYDRLTVNHSITVVEDRRDTEKDYELDFIYLKNIFNKLQERNNNALRLIEEYEDLMDRAAEIRDIIPKKYEQRLG